MGHRIWIGFSRVIAACAALMAAAAVASAARAEPPSFKLATAPLVSPSTAAGIYGSATTHTTGIAAWSPAPPEIVALARSLGATRASAAPSAGQISSGAYVRNVFDYVRNNIATEFRFGLSKGARGALIDQSGTPFDQAQLMYQLLLQAPSAAQITPSYQIGVISLTAQQFAQWTGFVQNPGAAASALTVNAQAACQWLADGGIPATVAGQNSCSSLSGNLSSSGASISMEHVWIQATVQGTATLYDPSFKQVQTFAPIGMASAMGCAGGTCGADAVSDITGASTQGTLLAGSSSLATLSNVNNASLNSQLTAWATSLEGAIKAQLSTAAAHELSPSTEKVIGGQVIDTTYAPTGGLAYSASASQTWTGEVPDQYRTTVIIGGSPGGWSFYADEIAGRRLRDFDQFFVDDQPLASNCSTSACTQAYSLSITHPYASPGYANETITYAGANSANMQFNQMPGQQANITNINTTFIVQLGDATTSTTQFYGDLQEADPSPYVDHLPPPNDSLCSPSSSSQINYKPYCRDDAQPTLVANYLARQSRADRLLGWLGSAQMTHHHVLGAVLGYEMTQTPAGVVQYYGNVISAQAMSSVGSTVNDPVVRTAVFASSADLGSMLEGEIYQDSRGNTNNTAIAALAQQTILTSGSAYNGYKTNVLIYVPDATSMTNLVNSGQIYNYPTTTASALTAAASDPNTPYAFIVPQYAIATGFFPDGQVYGFRSDREAYLLNMTLKGGASNVTTSWSDDVLKTVKTAAESFKGKKYASVNLATGVVTVTPPADMVTGAGEFPYSLPFQRYYSSGAGTRESVENSTDLSNPSGGTYPLVGGLTGEESDVGARLGGGWTHNYEISARISTNAMKAMGQDSALDASAFLAGAYALLDTRRTTGFLNSVTAMYVADWMLLAFDDNVVTVRTPPHSETFALLPDGTFNPPAGSASQLTSPNFNGPNNTTANYGQITFTYTMKDGSYLSLINSEKQVVYCVGPNCIPPTSLPMPVYRPTSWTFPDGMVVNFQYQTLTYQVGTSPQGATYDYLTKVSNSFGRSLTFATTADPSYIRRQQINSVTDDSGRSITFTRSNCPDITGGAGITALFNCNTLQVKLPDGTNSLQYGYDPNTDSPDPAVFLRPEYHLRRIFTPSNLSQAFETIAYDGMFRTATITDNLGHQSQYFASGMFDDWWKHGDQLDALNNLSTSTFDHWNDQLSGTDPLGRTTTFAYDDAHRRTLTTRPEQDSTAETYDVRSNVTSTTLNPVPGCTGSCTPLTTSTIFNEGVSTYPCATAATCNKPKDELDANLNGSKYAWNATGQLASVVTGLKNDYATCNLAGVTGCPETDLVYQAPTGTQVQLLATKTQKIDPSNTVTSTYSYSASNKFVPYQAIVDSSDTQGSNLNLTTTFTFDSIGNLTQVDGPRTDVSDVTNYTWDLDRRLLYTIQADPGTGSRVASLNHYDADSQLTEVDKGTATSGTGTSFAAAAETLIHYDAAGRKIDQQVLNGSGGSIVTYTQYSYDNDDRPQCTVVRMNTNAYGSIGSTGACTLGTAGLYGNDRITQLNYDSAGQLTSEVRGLGSANQITYATYTYGADGERKSVGDARSNLTSYVYDGFLRLSQTQFPTPGTQNQSNASDFEQYGYDLNGNMTSKRLRDGNVVTFCFDALNRQTQKMFSTTSCSSSGGTKLGSQDEYLGYDLLSRLLYQRYLSASGSGVTYVYDPAGRITSEASANGTVSYSYNNGSGDVVNRSRITWPDAFYVTYAFDAVGRPTDVKENGSVALAHYVYGGSSDPLQHLTQITRAGGAGASTTYTYDTLERLSTLADDFAGTVNDQTLNFTYNPASQITARGQTNTGFNWTNHTSGTSGHTYDGLNRDALIASVSGGYDGRQNLTNDGSRTYGYDLENRLISVGGSANLALAYDPLGRLQTLTPNGTSTPTQMLYSGDQLVGEYSSGSLLYRYVPSGLGEDKPMVWYQGSGTGTKYWLHGDNQGSVSFTSDGSGNQTANFPYGPYGEVQTWTGERFRYTGQLALADGGANLYFYKARVYDPARGWFLQTDPAGYKDDLDLYEYVKDDPVDRIDPTGLEWSGFSLGKTDPLHGGEPHDVKAGVEATLTIGSLAIPGPQEVVGARLASEVAEGTYSVYRGSQLARNMDAAGHGVVQGVEEAHHIVAQAAKAAAPARAVLARVGINIHSAENGAAVVKGAHQAIHTADYYSQVNTAVQSAEKGGADAVKAVLTDLKKFLEGK